MTPAVASLVLLAVIGSAPDRGGYFKIAVVDEQTGRGIPLVELRTVNEMRDVTDSAGIVAFNERGLMDTEVFFYVSSHGYEFPADGFGFRGRSLKTQAGETAELRLRRINVAERLYRVTGAGIYRDTLIVGGEPPIRHPLLNALVIGSDSVNTAVYHDQVYWFWGDTNRASYPLGTFHVPGAISRLPTSGGLDPARGVDLEYFQRSDGFAASTAEMPGDGPTWIDGLCVTRNEQGGERMFAKYVKVRKGLEVYQRGLVEFNSATNRFEKRAEFDFSAPLFPHGHSFNRLVDDVEYLYFGNPYPLVRVAATAEALADPRQFETFTCLKPNSTPKKPAIDRDSAGRVRDGWKHDLPATTAGEQAAWIKTGLLSEGEALLALRDVTTGRPVAAARRVDGLQRVSPPLGHDRRGDRRRHVESGRNLVCRSRHAVGPLDLRPQGGHARQIQLLQSQAPRHVRPAGRTNDLFRRHLLDYVFGGPGANAPIRLQPNHVPP